MRDSRRLQFGVMAALLVGMGFAVGRADNPASAPSGAACLDAATPSKMAVVDLVRVFGECDQIKDLNTRFQRTREDLSNEAAARRKSLDEAEIKMRAYRPGSNDYVQAKRELTKQGIEFKAWADTKEQEVKADEYRWMEHLYTVSCDVVQRLAERKGLDIVMLSEPFNAAMDPDNLGALQAQIRARKVVYRSASADITNCVIEEMNRDYRAKGGKESLGQ